MTNARAGLIATAIIIAGVLLAQTPSGAQVTNAPVAVAATGNFAWVAYGTDPSSPTIWRCYQNNNNLTQFYCNRVRQLTP
jgi:hypothetical protein